MKHIITFIDFELACPKFPDRQVLSFPIIPGTGSLSAKTSEDGATQEITVTARIASTWPTPEDYTSDMSRVVVGYSDELDGTIKEISFGSEELPARFTVEDNTTMSIKCTYTRIL